MPTDPDDTRRVELTPRQIRDLEKLQETWRSEGSTDEQRDDAAGITMGYIRSALFRRS